MAKLDMKNIDHLVKVLDWSDYMINSNRINEFEQCIALPFNCMADITRQNC